MDRSRSRSSSAARSVPHARGDGPALPPYRANGLERSPRTWGWTAWWKKGQPQVAAFPTHVGMDRRGLGGDPWHSSVPHARGDGPINQYIVSLEFKRSPRTWGWTVPGLGGCRRRRAFPTHVGMDRSPRAYGNSWVSVPHARGDGPLRTIRASIELMRSPRTWGWTVSGSPPGSTGGAFPTHVGMDRVGVASRVDRRCVPHARGDGPIPLLSSVKSASRSPRTWGWTGQGMGSAVGVLAFPTHVGMDRWIPKKIEIGTSVPHARGDGPTTGVTNPPDLARSPRTWGWTAHRPIMRIPPRAFPTHVGMDRSLAAAESPQQCVPHARGDGPARRLVKPAWYMRSPRTWGWT